jgi:methyl-accepting chemotaxis protein
VQEWSATGRQVKSALAPFNAERDGEEVRMLGAYATARLDERTPLGVIAIQDEHAALQSVTDMRRQTLYISLLAATFALLIGFIFAKQLTRPVRDLAAGAHRIASGDFSQRIEIRSRTERRPAKLRRGEPPTFHRHGQGARRRHRRQRPVHARPL